MEGEGEGAGVGAMDRVEASFVEKFVAPFQEIGRADAFTVYSSHVTLFCPPRY